MTPTTPTLQQIIELAREVANPETEDPLNGDLITLTVDEMQDFSTLLLERYGQPAAVAQQWQAMEPGMPKVLHQARSALLGPVADGVARRCAVSAIDAALAAVAQEPVKFGPLAKRRVFDYIRGAYDLGYNDARNAKAVPGDNAPGYTGRDVEADHGSALLHALEATPQPAAVREALNYDEFMSLMDSDGICIDPELAWTMKELVEQAHGIGSKA